MADQFDEPIIETNPEELVDLGVGRINQDFPNWSPAPAGFTMATLGANAVIIAELRDIAAVVPRSLFRTIVSQLFGIFPGEATPAEADVTVTAIDTAGYELEAGTQFTIAATGDRSEGFVLLDDLVIPPGIDNGGGRLQAILPGSQGSDLAGDVRPVQQLLWFESAVLSDPTSGGEDAEDDEEFLSRASQDLEALRPTLTLARDVPTFARRTPGVHRVYVIDNYNPNDDTDDNEKMVAVFPTDESGANVPAGTKTALAADLTAQRESGFVFWVRDPTRTPLRVHYKVKVDPNFDEAAVLLAVDDAVTSFLNPAYWGADITIERANWNVAATVVRRAKLIQIIENVDGVLYVPREPDVTGEIQVLLAKGADALATDDIALDLPAPLPDLTALTHEAI